MRKFPGISPVRPRISVAPAPLQRQEREGAHHEWKLQSQECGLGNIPSQLMEVRSQDHLGRNEKGDLVAPHRPVHPRPGERRQKSDEERVPRD